jgi:hypothetical protein
MSTAKRLNLRNEAINPSYCLATTTNQYKIRNTMHKHAAGRSWGLAKPAFFPTESITRANRAHSQLYFFPYWKKKMNGA